MLSGFVPSVRWGPNARLGIMYSRHRTCWYGAAGARKLSRDQFIWGLSNGVNVLAVSGAFWMGLAAWTLGANVLLITTAPILLLGGLLIWRGIRLRRQAPGFSRASLREAARGSATRRISISFQAVTATQTLSIVLVGFTCSILHRSDLIWPLIGLVVSLHFLPLGRLFSVRPYYVLGVLGTAVAVISLLGFNGSARLIAVGLGLGLVTSSCAIYLVANASGLADEALRNRPSPTGATPSA